MVVGGIGLYLTIKDPIVVGGSGPCHGRRLGPTG